MTDTDVDRTRDDQRTDTEHRDCDAAAAGRSNDRWADRTTPSPTRSLEPAPATGDAGSTERGLGRLDRRSYLKAIGAASAAGSLAGATSGTAAAQEDWEAAAEDRIEENRKSDLEITVEDDAGNPVSDAEVDVEMQEHEFLFGTAVHAEFLTEGTEWGEPIDDVDDVDQDQQQYRETIDELFNAIVLENVHKWYLWETNTDIADNAVDWALERDMAVRGHVCLWGNVGAWAVPPDVAEAMGANWQDPPDEYDGPDPDPQLVEEESMAHIDEVIEYYGDDIVEWEVVNEVQHVPDMITAVDGDGVTPSTAPILGDWYERAEEVAGQYDVGIAMNDYNVMVGPMESERQPYEDQADFLANERGVDLDGIGFQCHFGTNQTLTPDQIMENLDRFSEYADGLRTTEFDMFEGQWTQQEQAEFLHTYMKTFFSHPDAEQFMVWGHWDTLHWGPELGEEKDAPFYESDWTEKPALDEYRNLVFDEWWTDESGTTDADGTFSTSAFHGDYEVTVTADGDEETKTFELSASDGPMEVTVVAGKGQDACEDAADTETLDDGSKVCDLDGDGNYRDVNADGSVSNGDITDFFSNQHVDPWDSRTDLFDFDGDSDVGQGDVVELFNYVN